MPPAPRRRSRTAALGLAAFMAMGCASAAAAHDSWVVSDAQTVRLGAGSGATVRVAFVTAHEQFPVSEALATADRVASWVVMHDQRRVPLAVADLSADEDRQELFANVALREPGTHVVAVALEPRFIELEASAFQAYLQQEHAQAALEARARSGSELRTGRERYTKLAKTIVRVVESGSSDGGGQATQPVDRTWRHAIGHMLEVVPLNDPTRLAVGDMIEVRVLFDTDPAVDIHVASGHEGQPAHSYVQTARTNERGVARLRLDRPGHWFVRTHVIRPVDAGGHAGGDAAGTGDGAEWESFWASLTFRVDAARPGSARPSDSSETISPDEVETADPDR